MSRTASATVISAALVTAVLTGCGSGDDQPAGALPKIERIEPVIPPVTEKPNRASTSVPEPFENINVDGVALPAADLTPGDAFADVGVNDICQAGYRKSVRRLHLVDKEEAFERYGFAERDSDYTVDQLIPVSLGGTLAPSNVWPQPNALGGAAGTSEKDELEAHLRDLVCSGAVDLGTAQQAIATDWWNAYYTYMAMPFDPTQVSPEVEPPRVGGDAGVAPGQACDIEGARGHWGADAVPLTCMAAGNGQLSWQRRS